MPVRIYDISKKLGLENKEIIAKAKAMGIAAARVPSSALDKITAEDLENHLLEDHPEIAAKLAPKPLNPPVAEPIGVVRSPPLRQAIFALRPPQAPTPPQKPPVQLRPERQEPSPSQQFERKVRKIIEDRFPYSVLSNILLFHAERAHFASDPQEPVRSDYAVEIDHLLHRANEGTDNLILVECKNQPIAIRDERTWEVTYRDSQRSELGFQAHNVQHQIERHARAVRSYVNPIARGRQLSIDVIVVSNADETQYAVRHVRPGLTYYLVNLQRFTNALGLMTPPPLRIVQSDLLGLLRLGLPVAELGHPELPNAIAYIERCRRNLDTELFRAFEPTKERWAINGSAGMGKSVLLAYSLFVLTADRRVEAQGSHKQLVNFAEQAAQLNLPPLGQRRVYAFALKEKQRQVIETLFRRFVDDFSPLSKDHDLGIRRPDIRLWTGKIPEDCHVLVLDEAHDLSSAHARRISDWINAPGQKRYLLIACDRHQKLRLVGRDENIIEGVSFSLKTKKLRLNYRNPFAVYSASLGLMFRWFAKDGPKVLPTKDDLQNGFGFTVEENQPSGPLTLSMRNDAHPANSWSDCVSIFPNCEAVLARLRPCRFRPQDVLWVRFDDEDEHFDYEQLSCFTYHNLNSLESVELTDKYIKGQDFPIVVIEGFSEDMFAWNSPEAEQRMWQRRKELYVCSSRATAFLFLIPRVSSGDGATIREEIQELVRQLSTPHRDKDGFNRTWRFTISPTEQRRRMDVFTDANEINQQGDENQNLSSFEIGRAYSRKQISEIVGGSEVEYFPTKNDRVVCGCFTLEHNPEAPNIVIPGSGPIIEREAKLFCEQDYPVPVFIKRRPNEWEHVGDYKVMRFSNDPTEIAAHHKGSITPLNEVTRVIFLQRTAMPEGYKDQIDVLKPKVQPGQQQPTAPQPLPPTIGEMTVSEQMTVVDLAGVLKQKPFRIIADLMELGIFTSVHKQINFETITQVVRKYGYTAKRAD